MMDSEEYRRQATLYPERAQNERYIGVRSALSAVSQNLLASASFRRATLENVAATASGEATFGSGGSKNYRATFLKRIPSFAARLLFITQLSNGY
jgi:hypothetical protein